MCSEVQPLVALVTKLSACLRARYTYPRTRYTPKISVLRKHCGCCDVGSAINYLMRRSCCLAVLLGDTKGVYNLTCLALSNPKDYEPVPKCPENCAMCPKNWT